MKERYIKFFEMSIKNTYIEVDKLFNTYKLNFKKISDLVKFIAKQLGVSENLVLTIIQQVESLNNKQRYKKFFNEEDFPGIKVGDEVLGGKFKNKRMIVNDFGTDENDQPTIITDKGEKKLYTVRLQKESVGKNERFHFLRLTYDIAKADQLIHKTKHRLSSFNLKVLSKYFKMIRINEDYAMELTQRDLIEPGIAVFDKEKDFNFLIDGWHRAYNLFTNGKKTMKIWMIDDPEEIEAIRL